MVLWLGIPLSATLMAKGVGYQEFFPMEIVGPVVTSECFIIYSHLIGFFVEYYLECDV